MKSLTCVSTTFLAPGASRRYFGITSSGFPTATRRSDPTARRFFFRFSTDSSWNLPRWPPHLGDPHELGANVRGSKTYRGRTSHPAVRVAMDYACFTA